MKILITGANHENKGAESMLYVTVSEMYSRFPDAEIYYENPREHDPGYRFKNVHFDNRCVDIALGGSEGRAVLFKLAFKDFIKKLLGRKKTVEDYHFVDSFYSDTDMVVDVSGFALGEKWPAVSHMKYIKRIRLAKKYGIPVFLLPQSFGPFKYKSDEMLRIRDMLKDELAYCSLIFAREEQGYRELTEDFGLKNVVMSTDLVLQNRGIDPAAIWKKPPVYTEYPHAEAKAIGIVVNEKCFPEGEYDKVMSFYLRLITRLLGEDYRVVLLTHSAMDTEIVKKLKASFPENAEVRLEERELDCIEYGKYIKQFNFIICSRYHGIVHAYKSGVPCLVLGWAGKYHALGSAMGQEKYVFEIPKDEDGEAAFMSALGDMEEHFEENRNIICERLKDIQKDNCFDKLEELMKKRAGEKA